MDTVTLTVILGLVAAIGWGISDFLAAKSTRKVGPVLGSIILSYFNFVLFAVVYLLFLHQYHHFTMTGIWYAIAAGSVLPLALACFFVGLEAGPVSIVSPLSSTYPIITTLLAIVVFNGHLTTQQLIGIGLTVAGVVTASGLLNAEKNQRKLSRGPAFGLLAALFWGFGFALLAQAVKHMDWQLASLLVDVPGLIILPLLYPMIRGNEKLSIKIVRSGFRSRTLLFASLVGLVAINALNIALSKSGATSGAIPTAISATYPILTVLLALKHLQEKVALVPLAGAIVGIIGVVVLSLG